MHVGSAPPSEAIHWSDEILTQLQQAHSHDCNFRIDLIRGEDCSGPPLFIFVGSPKRKSTVMTKDGEPSPVSNQANLHLIDGVNPHHTEEIFTHPDRLHFKCFRTSKKIAFAESNQPLFDPVHALIDDESVLSKTGPQVDIERIDNHELTDVTIVATGGVVKSQQANVQPHVHPRG